ncbi:MAG TPA: hypothetical protein HA230_04275 [Candidatus Aenigmarchaeota archaeon]|nr:hypothetical protein [Candidatus Aenigmarchaeota archaeon]
MDELLRPKHMAALGLVYGTTQGLTEADLRRSDVYEVVEDLIKDGMMSSRGDPELMFYITEKGRRDVEGRLFHALQSGSICEDVYEP